MKRGKTRAWLALSLIATAPALAAEAPRMAPLRLEDLTDTRDRPLFSPSRRPAPQPTAAVAEGPVVSEAKASNDDPPPFDLVGVIIGGANPVVLLSRHGGDVRRLRLGDLQDGWRVAEITLRSVKLTFGDRPEWLALTAPISAPVAAAPSQIAERRPEDAAITPGPVRDEYRRLMKQITAKR